MIKTIYAKLVLIFVCIFIIGNFASFLITSITAEKSLVGELEAFLTESLYTAKDLYEKDEATSEVIERLYGASVIYVRFYDNPNRLIQDYKLLEKKLSLIGNEPMIFKEAGIVSLKPRIPVAVLKSGDVYIAATPKSNSLLLEFRNIILKASIISLLFGSAAMLIVAWFIVKPIKLLSDATEKIAKGDFGVYIKEKRNDEIGQLVRNFNTMTRELSGMEILRNNFISDISHEFKTPITSIEGYAKLLRYCNNDEERNEYIDIITDETRRLSILSGNILLLNRIENESIRLSKKPFRLDEQIRRVILLHENKWSSKNIELQLDLEEIIYEGNEQLLYQVWLNLFDNAVKFSKLGGEIEVRLKKVDDKKVFTITDYGKGMMEEEKNRMFEKFFTGDRSRNTEGNGLGLSIVKRVIDMHNGDIKVFSRINEFTEIKVIL